MPLRFIFEALGADVDWDNDTQTVTAVRQDTVITLTIGSNLLFVNGKAVELDVPAKLVSDRTLVPVRAVSESFACEVDWINETKTVVILQQS